MSVKVTEQNRIEETSKRERESGDGGVVFVAHLLLLIFFVSFRTHSHRRTHIHTRAQRGVLR